MGYEAQIQFDVYVKARNRIKEKWFISISTFSLLLYLGDEVTSVAIILNAIH